MTYIVVPLVLVGVIGLYILTYYLNGKTKTPDGIEQLSKCSTCGSGSCSFAGTERVTVPDNCELEDFNLEEFKSDQR